MCVCGSAAAPDEGELRARAVDVGHYRPREGGEGVGEGAVGTGVWIAVGGGGGVWGVAVRRVARRGRRLGVGWEGVSG